jgi:integral membrane protein (TIGR00529 family)
MIELIGIVIAFVIIFVLRFKAVDFALTILVASAIIGATSGKPFTIFWDVLVRTASDYATWDLCASVALITVLSYALKETGMMEKLIQSLRSFLPSRVLLALIPALFGILSMPGGALMSAPFNEPEAERLRLKPEQRTYINVWFRHVWYWASPISPSTILATSLAGVALRDFIISNLPLFVAAWTIGFLVSWRFVKEDHREDVGEKNYLAALTGLSPILVTVALTLVGVSIWLSVAIGVVIVVALNRVDAGRTFGFLKKGVKWDIVTAVFATLYFRYMMVTSGSVESVFRDIISSGVPILALMIFVPILVGAISGTPTMGIGIAFPLLLPLVVGLDVHNLTIMFAGLVSGYTISPMHLCLILTNQYYRSDLNRVYRYLVPSIIVLYVLAVIYHLVTGGL